MPVYPARVCVLCNLQTIMHGVCAFTDHTYNYASNYLICF